MKEVHSIPFKKVIKECALRQLVVSKQKYLAEGLWENVCGWLSAMSVMLALSVLGHIY